MPFRWPATSSFARCFLIASSTTLHFFEHSRQESLVLKKECVIEGLEGVKEGDQQKYFLTKQFLIFCHGLRWCTRPLVCIFEVTGRVSYLKKIVSERVISDLRKLSVTCLLHWPATSRFARCFLITSSDTLHFFEHSWQEYVVEEKVYFWKRNV
jgi:hypothetical protein